MITNYNFCLITIIIFIVNFYLIYFDNHKRDYSVSTNGYVWIDTPSILDKITYAFMYLSIFIEIGTLIYFII